MDSPDPSEARRDTEVVLRAFVDAHGRLSSIPTKLNKRLVVLELIAGDFEVGVRYREVQVNEILNRRHADHAALRRYLVERGFLDRADGYYWRVEGAGGPG